MNETNAIEALEAFVARHGSQEKAAKALGVKQAYVSQMINGRRDVTTRVLAKLGLKRIVVPKGGAA